MKITSPSLAYRFLQTCLRTDIEEFWAIALNSEKEILQASCIFRGTVDWCLFHPRDVFRFAYVHNASSLIVAHNHPSGHAYPSPQDQVTTQQLMDASELLQVPVLDHLILGLESYYSYLEAGAIFKVPAWPSDPSLD